MDDHPYLLGYLVGSGVAVFLGLFVILEFQILSWIVKGNVCRGNLNKIQDPETQGFKASAKLFLVNSLEAAVMSWLAVLQYLWRAFWMPISVVREALSSVPEEIKSLRYPLYNNPDLSRESVWAYACALKIKTGATVNAIHMKWGLEEIEGYYPSFDSEAALATLQSLVAIDEQTLIEVISRIRESSDC